VPRIRTIKPELWADEKLARLDIKTRLAFLGLISMADDAGRLLDNVKVVDAFIFPLTTDSSADALDILARLGRILRYCSSSGQPLIQIVNWSRHQKVDNPCKYTLPAPTIKDLAALAPGDGSRQSREISALPSREPVDTTNDRRSTTKLPTSANGAQPPSADATQQHRRSTWISSYCEEWEKRIGGKPPTGRMLKALAPLIRQDGHAIVRATWYGYLADVDPQYASVGYFVSHYGTLRSQWAREMVDGEYRPMSSAPIEVADVT
jgi:hypothetical protein